MTQRIDAHHHLWHYTAAEFGWIGDDMRSLRRDFLPADLLTEAAAAGVTGTVAVQARQSEDETRWLLDLAREYPLIRGVVGWLPIASEDFSATLDDYRAEPLLKGLRHVAQAEPAGFLLGHDFNRGIALLQGAGLVYDILIFAPQLAEATAFVDGHPGQQFVLDHIAKPAIRHGETAPWAEQIRALAERPNVCCKLSGMVTEADSRNWTPAQLKPYFDVVLDAFGPNRLMTGTDWPVLSDACSYPQWWQIVESWIAPLSTSEQADILAGTATRIYSLTPATHLQSSPVER